MRTHLLRAGSDVAGGGRPLPGRFGTARHAEGRPFSEHYARPGTGRSRLSRKGQGWFEQPLGSEVKSVLYNAGPSAMEAIFADSIDLTFVGPSPAINAYAKARGEDIRIIAHCRKAE